VGSDPVGTIFAMVDAVGSDDPRYTSSNARIRHYQDDLPPAGTEFLVRAYAERRDPDFGFPPTQGWQPGWEQVADAKPNAIYGFGKASLVETLKQDLSRKSAP
jgi:hypothetical protein